jgi:O-antigen biosynthesis protein
MNKKISIFTPTHDLTYIGELYESIKDQDFYEWVIVLNGPAVDQVKESGLFAEDPRVVTIVAPPDTPPYVGALKRFACNNCTGDIFLEADHDDLLLPGVFDRVREAFADDSVGFVYSDSANFSGDFEMTPEYDPSCGWQYRWFDHKGHPMRSDMSFPLTPLSCSQIWFAPNHLRAWSREAYWEAGGHNPNMRVMDDQDLISRTYLITKFAHIDECLYLYRITGKNTWLEFNQEIQESVPRIREQYLEQMILKWCHDNSLMPLDLGAAHNPKPGYVSVDLHDADIIADLNGTWPFPDNSVGVIRAFDVFEHLKDPLHTMKEVYRVLAPDGHLIAQVPSTDGRGAFQDPTHVSFWNQNSWLYYTDYNWGKYIGSPVRFMEVSCSTSPKDDREVCWTFAHLVALKGNRPPGVIKI